MDFKEQLLSRGYVVYNAKHLSDFLDIETVEFKLDPKTEHVDPETTPANNVEMMNSKLMLVHHEIAREFLGPHVKSYKLLHRNIWEGNILNADKWHTDSFEAPDLFFLLYFNDMPNNEGALCVRNSKQESTIEIGKGTLVAIENNDPSFEHRVEPFKNKRVAACFRFAVEWE